jgi:NADPH:quinone reductase-like Zn-dependent oxidoreductase
VTVGQSLYKTLQLPLPTIVAEKPITVLIYAASTAVGMYGIQFAKASGLTVIATSSPHNFDKIRALGADAVFDYHSPSCALDIKEYTQNQLRHSWDCVGTGNEICAKAMSTTEKCFYSTINPLTLKEMMAMRRANPKLDSPKVTMGYDACGDPYIMSGKIVPAKPDEMKYAIEFLEISRELLTKGVVKPIHVSVNQTGSGLEGALKGLDELRAGRVSGSKLVYTL